MLAFYAEDRHREHTQSGAATAAKCRRCCGGLCTTLAEEALGITDDAGRQTRMNMGSRESS
jgi:hypothetical protein